MTDFSLRTGSPTKSASDVVVVALTTAQGRGKTPVPVGSGTEIADAMGRRFAPLLTTLGFSGKPGEAVSVPLSQLGKSDIKTAMLLLVGVGDEVTEESMRRASGVAARHLHNAAHVALAFNPQTPQMVEAITVGFTLGGYRYDRFKSVVADEAPGEVVILTDRARTKGFGEAVEAAVIIAEAIARTRDWVNSPPGHLRPSDFAAETSAVQRAFTQGKTAGSLSLEITERDELESLGCGGLIGVGRGSSSPPVLVTLSYTPKVADSPAVPHLALVGKGITFDSGGLSLKPANSMGTMKMDMAGAASVISATLAIAALDLPVQVTAYAALAENMVSGDATRPGDVLTMYRGKTVEVLNTDAEGRLVLADALGLAVEAEPDAIIDVATLTGACMVALGDRISGLFTNDESLGQQVRQAALRGGDGMWPMPIGAEMTKKVRTNSRIADLAQHNAERWGGAMYAAAFLQEFVDEVPWVHLDIAGPAYNEKAEHGYITAGGTGASVATLIEVARGWTAGTA